MQNMQSKIIKIHRRTRRKTEMQDKIKMGGIKK